jgi:hypothetical protein
MGDNLGMMQQLGVIPQPGNTEEALTLRKGHSTAWVVTRSSVTRPGGLETTLVDWKRLVPGDHANYSSRPMAGRGPRNKLVA